MEYDDERLYQVCIIIIVMCWSTKQNKNEIQEMVDC